MAEAHIIVLHQRTSCARAMAHEMITRSLTFITASFHAGASSERCTKRTMAILKSITGLLTHIPARKRWGWGTNCHPLLPPTNKHTHTHTHMHTHAHTHTYTRPRAHTHTHTHTHTRPRTHTHARTHTHIHAHTHTHTHKHARTHAHTHTQTEPAEQRDQAPVKQMTPVTVLQCIPLHHSQPDTVYLIVHCLRSAVQALPASFAPYPLPPRLGISQLHLAGDTGRET